MPVDKTIFGLRFGANHELSPTREEMEVFLKSPKKRGGSTLHGHDTAPYREMLRSLEEFEEFRQQPDAVPNLREKMFNFVVGHSCFFNSSLKSAVEQYKYYLNELTNMDLRKLTSFITAAREEMKGLKPRKKEDAMRLAKLEAMIADRQRKLQTFKRRRMDLAAELAHIARYIADNLVKIDKLCETAIVVLVNVQIGRSVEGRMIDELKDQFKDHIDDYLRKGSIPGHDIGAAQDDLALLSKGISDLFREDVYALTGLYEAIYEHAQNVVRKVTALLAEAGNGGGKASRDEREIYTRIGDVLISLVSDYRFELKPTPDIVESAHKDILLQKRKEILAHLFHLLQQERRARTDRRMSPDRRRFKDAGRKSPERRSGRERRSGKSRRT